MRIRTEWALATLVGTVALWTASVVCAQDAAAGSAQTKPAMMARDADPDWEVATIKPSDPNDKNEALGVHGRHVVAERETAEKMLVVAYGLQRNQIANAPEWVKTENFDVDGVPDLDGQPNVKQFQSLMRKLLTERFGLKLHMEQREMEVYALTVTKGGPKLAPTKSDPDSLPDQAARRSDSAWTLQFTNVSMQDVTVMMLYYLDRPLVDQTGLQGRYDFTLKWTFNESKAPTDGSAPPSLFTAIQEQDGLKLDAARASAPVLVIDKIERPAEN